MNKSMSPVSNKPTDYISNGDDSILAFIHIQKTAGTTVRQILRQSFGARHCDIRPTAVNPPDNCVCSPLMLLRTKRIYRRLESIAGHPVVPYLDYESVLTDIRYFTFLRDPLERAASDYQMTVNVGKQKITLGEWIQYDDRARNWQTRCLCGDDDADSAIRLLQEKDIFVGLLSHFDESLVMLRQWSGKASLDLRYEQLNKAADTSLRDRILNNPENRMLLEDANREDLKLWSYVKDIYFPDRLLQYKEILDHSVNKLRKERKANSSLREPITGVMLRDLVYKPLCRFVGACDDWRDSPKQ